MIECTKCLTFKETTEFGTTTIKKNDKVYVYTKKHCKECNRARARSYYQDMSSSDRKSLWKKYRLNRRYNISLEDYDIMLAEQNGVCYICRERDKQLVVDHCHKTGKVRKILCYNCNVSLGLMKEDISLLHRMEEYIKEHGNL